MQWCRCQVSLPDGIQTNDNCPPPQIQQILYLNWMSLLADGQKHLYHILLSQHTNGPKRLECFIRLGLSGRNTVAFWPIHKLWRKQRVVNTAPASYPKKPTFLHSRWNFEKKLLLGVLTCGKMLRHSTPQTNTYKKRLVSRINPSLLLKIILYITTK